MKALIPAYVKAQSWFNAKVKDEKGATMVEYALMLVLIAVVCVAAVTAVGDNANTTYGTVRDALVP